MYEINALIEGKRRLINEPQGIRRYFNFWKKLRQKVDGKSDFDFESFLMGYTIGNNPILREKILNKIYTEKAIQETFDDHINK